MRKILTIFSICIFAPLLAGASTCETRVDSHQKASTVQRVSYCLTPDIEAPAAQPQLVYYGVADKTPAKTQAAATGRSTHYFDEEGVGVARNYVGTGHFPVFTNDVLSEQERIALQKAYQEELAKARLEAAAKAQAQKKAVKADAEEAERAEKAKKQPNIITCYDSDGKVVKMTKKTTGFVETSEGYALRQQKPRRTLKVPVSELETYEETEIIEQEPQAAPVEEMPTETDLSAYGSAADELASPYGAIPAE